MSREAMRELVGKMFDLYERKEYAQAYELVTEQADEFPEWARRIYFWRACLATRDGKIDHALDLLEEAMERGHWFWITGLREDPDLEPLQGLNRFEALVSESARLQEAARRNSPPADVIILEPEEEQLHNHLLIALHGNYSSAEDSIKHWKPAATMGWIVALPESTQTDGPDDHVWNDRDWTLTELRNQYRTLSENYAIGEGHTVFGGFSMGGWWAIWLALAESLPTRGFVAVAPFIPDIEWLKPVLNGEAAPLTRGYVIAGEEDSGSLRGAKKLVNEMNRNDMPCELELHPGLGHAFPEDFKSSLRRALEYVTKH